MDAIRIPCAWVQWLQEEARNAVDLHLLCPASSHAEDSLAASQHLVLTVCLSVSVCISFKVPGVAGDLRDSLWLCQGSCLRQSCCTVSKLSLWESPGEVWCDKDAVLIYFFLTSLESAEKQLALGSLWTTDIAKEETSVQSFRFSRFTVVFPGCSWLSPESDSSG